MTVSAYLIAGFGAWLVAQGCKVVLDYQARRLATRHWSGFYRSGGMPSAHAASMVAVTTVIGGIDGFDSGLFGLALLLACIVMYDALMVRRSSGLQGELLTKLAGMIDKTTRTPTFAKGHTPLEVLVGAVVGLLVGCVVFFATI